jgi:23S rRNA pseudouridine1911/1915/1917 synthase
MTYIREFKATPTFLESVINFYLPDAKKIDRKFITTIKVMHPMPHNTVISCRVKTITYWVVIDYTLADDEAMVLRQIEECVDIMPKGKLLKTLREQADGAQYADAYREMELYVYQEENARLDMHVSDMLSGQSRSYAAKLIEAGRVTVNGEAVTKPSYKMQPTDVVEIEDIDQEIRETIDVEVIYEDDNTIVLCKPEGMLTHAKGEFYPEQTVATTIADKISFPEITNRSGIVHRLDRGTSGIILCAKHPGAMRWYQKQFANRNVKKTYIAITTEVPKNEHAIIDLPIERNPKKPQMFRVGPQGKSALTEYWVQETKNRKALVELKPTTGRTHQLRVHLAYINAPIVGDVLYGGAKANRLMLHAKSLEVTMYDTHERKVFTAPLPGVFRV